MYWYRQPSVFRGSTSLILSLKSQPFNVHNHITLCTQQYFHRRVCNHITTTVANSNYRVIYLWPNKTKPDETRYDKVSCWSSHITPDGCLIVLKMLCIYVCIKKMCKLVWNVAMILKTAPVDNKDSLVIIIHPPKSNNIKFSCVSIDIIHLKSNINTWGSRQKSHRFAEDSLNSFLAIIIILYFYSNSNGTL